MEITAEPNRPKKFVFTSCDPVRLRLQVCLNCDQWEVMQAMLQRPLNKLFMLDGGAARNAGDFHLVDYSLLFEEIPSGWKEIWL